MGINALILVVLYGLVSFNKVFLRPFFSQDSYADILTGCFPNFIAGFLISLSIVSPVLIRKPGFSRQLVWAGSLMVFIILAIEEFKPFWGASTVYDPYDIAASAAGSLLAIGLFEVIDRHQRK